MVRVMSPETVAWMLRQMNPVEAGRVGTRLGVKVLSLVFGQLHPAQALATLRRLPFLRPHKVAESLDRSLEDEGALAHGPDTAGSLMVAELPIVDAGALVQSARQNLGELAETRDKITHVYVLIGGELAGQVSMVDLALADDATPVRDVASPIVATVTTDTPAEECARLRRHYNLTQLPVVDGPG